jgi:cytochrome c oxidase subunit 3
LSESHNPALAHQFDDMTQQREAGSLGMWLFLITEIMFFGGMFTGYAVYRAKYYDAFVEGSHHLDVQLGAINTAVLVFSSLTMAMAVHAAQLGKKRAIIVWLVLTILLGGAFLGIKTIEYSDKYHHGLIPGALYHPEAKPGAPAPPREMQIFYSFYFAMTGMHALHMVIGIVIMLVLIAMAARNRFNAEYYAPVEISGLYWHFVDIVWIFLFPLLYLIGRHGPHP